MPKKKNNVEKKEEEFRIEIEDLAKASETPFKDVEKTYKNSLFYQYAMVGAAWQDVIDSIKNPLIKILERIFNGKK
ncbi:hypothetical protein KAU51_04165 [Candidatus Parcubacteria bacterium]|nr:hypothetical protein [Candidatus Parcubacteria bacterium]